ncbi:AraC family transcriptional regulator [Chitinimonas koreensis]|uniref:AraC family transcriptional regulator n=1 Tax=Chitinimonas koreensis TaxID=356302 RepID=UPI000686777A|nr:AraC family transcriptional regulator [Chitinimonas koreensis]QNM97840.1 AraC family transcriptional regulator ligand-binding domain-containing protein [Chitinimonas koreensis]
MLPIDCAIAPNPRVVSPYASTLREAALAAGLPASELAASGVPTGGEADVPVAAYLDLLRRAVAHAGPAFGWRLGQAAKPTTYGVNGILLLSCPTLGEALQQVLRFEALVHDLGRSSLSRQGELWVYGWRNDWSGHPAAAALAESVFAGIRTCAEWLAGRPLQGFELEFAHAGDSAALAQLAGVPVRHGCAANRVLFPAELLDWPVPQANNGLLALLQNHAEALLRERHRREPEIVGQVRSLLLARLGEGGATRLAEVADALHLSTRTLQRRLGEAGLAFQDLLDRTRHELARHYLDSSALPIGEIAYLLGYRDPAAFHHAFKGWQGEGPGAYRERNRRA